MYVTKNVVYITQTAAKQTINIYKSEEYSKERAIYKFRQVQDSFFINSTSTIVFDT